MTTRVYLGIGSNLNRQNALRFARAKLAPMFENFRVSSVWCSHAIRSAEPDYLNMVAGGDTALSLDRLYAGIEDIERLAGMEMMFHQGTNFGLRHRLDIDILLFGETVTNTPCKLPRHDIQDYPFVLCPLCELDAGLVHPLLKLRIGDIWKEMEPRLPDSMKLARVEFDWSPDAPQWKGEAAEK